MIISDAILGLSPIKFLLHLLNFSILFLALWFLLYKPVLKSIKNRQDGISKQKKDSENMLLEAQATKVQYETKLAKANVEIEYQRNESEQLANALREETILDATKKAKAIIFVAEENAKAEVEKTLQDAKSHVKEIAVALAENIIGRSVKASDDEAFIDNCIKDWKND